MKFGVYAIEDSKTTFMAPMVDINDASAMRNFENAVRQADGLLNSHPADFAFYRIGYFDNESGELIPESPLRFLCDANSILWKEAKVE